MKTRLISLILALAMALSLLTGCAGGTAPAAGNGAFPRGAGGPLHARPKREKACHIKHKRAVLRPQRNL